MKTVCIINPTSSAKYLSEVFRSSHIKTIAIYTNINKLSEYSRPAVGLFDEEYHIESFDFKVVYPQIKDLKVDYVINGTDQTVGLTDQIANKLCPKYANNSISSEVRQSKFLQQEALSNHNIPTVKQSKMSRYNLDNQALQNFTYPIFAKPANGAASIGAFKADSYNELIDILRKQPKNVFFEEVDEYIFQEYITGEELFVDSFSINGHHLISGVYRYRKDIKNNSPIYRYIEIIRDVNVIEDAVKFVSKVLSATELEHGFAHTELFLTNNGYRLIEVNPRISGAVGQINLVGKAAGIVTQDEYLIQTIFNKVNYHELKIAMPKQFARVVLLYTHKKIDITSLKTFHSALQISNEPLRMSSDTINLTDVHQFVLLASTDKSLLDEDTNNLIDFDVI